MRRAGVSVSDPDRGAGRPVVVTGPDPNVSGLRESIRQHVTGRADV